MEEIVSALHLCATNDTNGNPRRVYVGFNLRGHVVATSDEGYVGYPQWLRDLHKLGVWETAIKVPVSEYVRFADHPMRDALR